MDHEKFKVNLAKTAIATGGEVTDMILSVYWDEFQNWTDDQFLAALQRCRNELSRFPTVAQIKERFVSCAHSNAVQVIESSVPRIANPEVDQDNLTKAAQNMTDQEIKELMEARGYNAAAIAVVIMGQVKAKLRMDLLKDLIRPGWDDGSTYAARCHKCEDRGAIEVYSPKSYLGVDGDTYQPTDLRIKTVMVSCECQAGESHRRPVDPHKDMNRSLPMLEFNENTMLPVSAIGLEDQQAELYLFLKNDYKPAKFFSEFADW